MDIQAIKAKQGNTIIEWSPRALSEFKSRAWISNGSYFGAVTIISTPRWPAVTPCPIFIFAVGLKGGGDAEMKARAADSWVHRVHLQACVRHWPVPWQSARVPRRYVQVDWEKTKRRENTWRLKILAVYLRPNERSSLIITCLLRLLILKAMYFNGLKLVACGSIERRYFKQGCGLN